MGDETAMVERFEAHRPRLRAVAYRMLGSLSAADDAVQDAWLRYAAVDPGDVDNPGGWLTTVVGRICLDQLRARRIRAEQPLAEDGPVADVLADRRNDPERAALLTDAVGPALLVVMDALAPAERVAFVLHDLFGTPFTEIAAIVDRTPEATRQLASRARRRVRGRPVPDVDLVRQREVVAAFLAAARGGDLGGLLAVLAPDVVLHVDPAAAGTGRPVEERGADTVAERALSYSGRGRFAQLAVLDDVAVGIVVAPRGRVFGVLRFAVDGPRITRIDVIGDAERLRRLRLTIPEA